VLAEGRRNAGATAAQAEKEDATPPGHSLIFTVLFFGFFGHLHSFLGKTPDIFGWLYSELCVFVFLCFM